MNKHNVDLNTESDIEKGNELVDKNAAQALDEQIQQKETGFEDLPKVPGASVDDTSSVGKTEELEQVGPVADDDISKDQNIQSEEFERKKNDDPKPAAEISPTQMEEGEDNEDESKSERNSESGV